MLLSRKTAYIFIAFVGVGVIATAAWTVIGGTTLNLTLTSNPNLEDGLVGHWTMDGSDTVTNIADRSGQGNDGKLNMGSSGNTSTTTAPGRIGQALDFDGDDDYVAIDDDNSLDLGTGDFSFSLWVKTTQDCSGNKVWLGLREQVDSRPSIWLGCNGSHEANVSVTDSDDVGVSATYTSFPINDGAWYHVVAVKSGHGSANVTLYVNNNPSSSGSASYTGDFNFDGTNPHSIGQFQVSPFYNADATIDDVRIYDRALSEEEIGRLYELGKSARINTEQTGPKANKLIGHWTFDGGDMTTNVADVSGSGNDGKLSDSRGTTTTSGRLGQAIDLRTSGNSVTVGDTTQNARTAAFWLNPETDNENILKLGGGSGNSWYDSNYSFCRNFTINSNQVATTTSAGFALIATSTISDLKHTDHGGDIQLLQEDDSNTPKQVPQDVVITDGTDCNSDGGSKIDFFFEEYASTTGAFTAWVEHPDVSSTTDKEMLMYYGNSSATDQSNESGVFGGLDEQGVWNLHEDPGSAGTDGIIDSTANNNHGTDNGTMASDDLVSGTVDGALDFDGSDDYVQLSDYGTIQDWTFCLWMDPVTWTPNDDASLNDVQGFFSDIPSQGGTFEARIWDNGGSIREIHIGGGSGVGVHLARDVSSETGEHLVCYAQDRGTDTRRGYWDGSEFGSAANTDYGDLTGDDAEIAKKRGGSNNEYAGVVDDVRVYGRTLTESDLTTIYNNTADNTSFWTIGAEETEASSDVSEINTSGGSVSTKGVSNTTTYVNGTTGSSVTADTWQHIALTFDATSTDDVKIGTNPGGEFNGEIDDVRLYTNALSAGDIKRLYELGKSSRINKTLTTNPNLEDGLQGHWTMDGPDTLTNIADTSGQGNDGKLNMGSSGNTSTTTASGRIGQALEFDGDDDYVQLSVDYSELGDWTVCFWGDPATWDPSPSGNNDEVFWSTGMSQGGTLDIRLRSSEVHVGGGSGVSVHLRKNVTNEKGWHFVCITQDRSTDTRRGYWDGAEYDSSTNTDFGNFDGDRTPDPTIAQNRTGGENIDGKIDDARLYDRALSAEEIERLYEMGR